MAKAVEHQPKKRGRPATGLKEAVAVNMRLSRELAAQVDVWAKANECTRSTAIRIMLEFALAEAIPAESLQHLPSWVAAHKPRPERKKGRG